MKVVHSWLKEYVGADIPEADRIEELLNFHAFEVEGVETVGKEQVIDVDVLPNRSSDCLCHRGIARELASILAIDLANDPLSDPVKLALADTIEVSIEDAHECPRFTAGLISGIEVKESPKWLQQRLEALGQRSINNIVDATNYVMYAIGQPLHAYDADLFPQVEGKWQFEVRKAKAGETVSLLAEGGKEEDRVIECVGTELLIVDGSSGTPIGLAGVKGGRYAGVHEGTTRIIVEAAHFDPLSTRATARRLGIVIDASKRFENEPSRLLPPYAQSEIVKLIEDIAGGKFEGMVDEYLEPRAEVPVKVTVAKTNGLLGLSLSKDEIKAILLRIGVTVSSENDSTLTVVGPWERTDLLIEEDIIEEVGRIYGLDAIESVVPEPRVLPEVNKRQYYTDAIRHVLLTEGFSEVITSSFQKQGEIQLKNSLASDKSFVRSNLHTNLKKVLDANFTHVDLLGVPALRVFEIGTVFNRTDTGVSEHLSLALGARSKGNGYSPKDDAPLAEAMSALESVIGEVEWDIDQGTCETDLAAVLETLSEPSKYDTFEQKPQIQYRTISPYPAIARDIALWVSPETEAMAVMRMMAEQIGGLCARIDLFDEFTKEQKTSLAFRIVFQSESRTLTDAEVNSIMEKLYAKASESGWEVR